MDKRIVSGVGALGLIVGAVGGNLITSSEGKRNTAYRDTVGIWTICYGHTGPEVHRGLVYTDAQCDALLASDIAKHQVVLIGPKSCIGDALKPKSNRLDAVTSITFNIGTGRFCGSTMAKRLKAKNYAAASLEFPKWNKAGGKVLPGLVTRRAKEQALFNSTAEWKPYAIKTTVIY